jgi:hypothetical protein
MENRLSRSWSIANCLDAKRGGHGPRDARFVREGGRRCDKVKGNGRATTGAQIHFILNRKKSPGFVALGISRGSFSPDYRHLHAQIITPPVMHPGAPADADRNPGMPPDPMQDLMADKSKLARNDERQRKLVSDTDRLLLLANQLKSEVAASGSETMTPLMLHQMDEIEKLARSVKEKMRN